MRETHLCFLPCTSSDHQPRFDRELDFGPDAVYSTTLQKSVTVVHPKYKLFEAFVLRMVRNWCSAQNYKVAPVPTLQAHDGEHSQLGVTSRSSHSARVETREG